MRCITLHPWIAAALGSLGLLGSACVPVVVAQKAYDRQACAENAMRRRPDREAVADLGEQLAMACRFGDLPACSMLGVAHELGVGVRRDRARAAALYREACEGGNLRGCGNLGELMLQNGEVTASPGGLALLQNVCELGQARACLVLGRAHVDGRVGTPALGGPFLERACDGDEGAACIALADLVERGLVAGGAARVASLAAVACGYGDEEGCARMTRPRRSPRPPERTVLVETPR